MSEINYLKLAAEAKRETATGERLRKMDVYEIINEIHGLEDKITQLEERLYSLTAF